MNHRKCIGCGSILQTKDESLPGYILPHLYEEEDVLCKRCFGLNIIAIYRTLQ